MALEQNEIKKVITVDLGSATTSLKEYKKHIDELRGSLLQLDSTSEEYQKIAAEIQSEQDKLNEVMRAGNTTITDAKKHIDELRGSLLQLDSTSEEYQAIAAEIKVEQEKLNEVMSVGKNVTEAADGSYDKLVQTMAELKKQWRATGDEAERNELGTKILDINNQLKELDASTGNFQRNVGDYANAFEEAFKRCLDGITRIDGPLGEIGGTVKNMLPIIKNINKTATTGLAGIKKGIASTGIGLLVVALGMIVAYWDDITDATNRAIRSATNYKGVVDNIKEITRQLKESTQQIKIWSSAFGQAHKLRVAQGMDENESLQLLYTETQNLINQTKAQLALKKEESDVKEKEIQRIKREISNREIVLAQGAENLSQYFRLKNEIKDLNKQLENYEDETSEVSEANDELNSQLAEQLKLLDDIDKQMQINSADAEKTAKEETEAEAQRIANENESRRKELETQLEAERKEAQAIAENARKASMSELQLLDEKYAESLAKLEKFGLDTTVLTENYEKERTRIVKEEEEKRKQAEQEKIDAIQAAEDERFSNIKERYDAEAEQLKFEAEMDIENERAMADAKFEIEQDLLERKIALQEQYIEEYNGTQEGLIEAEAELDALRLQYSNNKRKYDKESADFAKKQAEEEKQAKTAALNATLGMTKSVLGSIADLYEEGSQEQKNLQIAETTINTLAGAIGAFLQGMSSYPAPYGAIIGAASAATATAAGIAQIAKIKSTSMGSSGSVASPQVSAPSMTSVSPLLDETTDINRLTTLSEQGDSARNAQNTRVYVVEQDIRDAGHKAEVVEDNATF